MKTSQQVAEQIAQSERFAGLTDDDLGRSVEEMMVAAIETYRTECEAAGLWQQIPAVKAGYIVFTGTYEIWHSFDQAKERIEELLDAGHESPTVIKVELTEEDGTEVLGITAHKIADVSKAGEIR